MFKEQLPQNENTNNHIQHFTNLTQSYITTEHMKTTTGMQLPNGNRVVTGCLVNACVNRNQRHGTNNTTYV